MLASLSDLLLKLMGKRQAGSPSALTNPAMGPCQARRVVQARLRTTRGGYARLRMDMLRLTALLFLILAAPAAARPGQLDRSFAGGRVTLTRTHDQGIGASVSVRGSAVLAAGLLGDGMLLARLPPSGRPATRARLAMGVSPLTLPTLVQLPDGRVLIAGLGAMGHDLLMDVVYVARTD